MNDNLSPTDDEICREKTARYFSSHVPALLKKLKKVLLTRLQQEPQNGELWFQLGNIYRGIGELKSASCAFQNAEKLNQKKHSKSLLNGSLWPNFN